MTEITQADRDAAARIVGAFGIEREEIVKAGWADDHSMVQAFARHRIEAEQKIVAWLRTQDDPNEKWALQNSHWYAAEIEAGSHLK